MRGGFKTIRAAQLVASENSVPRGSATSFTLWQIAVVIYFAHVVHRWRVRHE